MTELVGTVRKVEMEPDDAPVHWTVNKEGRFQVTADLGPGSMVRYMTEEPPMCGARVRVMVSVG